MVVGASGTRIQIEHEGYVSSMILADPKEHVPLGSRSNSPGNRKNCSDVLFANTIVMAGSGTGKFGHLVKLFQVCRKVSGCEGRPVVTDVVLDHHSKTGSKLFEPFYNGEGFVGARGDLGGNVGV